MRDRREERREYEGDVYYEVWRSGRNPDAIDYDRVDDHFYAGDYYEQAAAQEIEAQRPRPPEPEYDPEEQP